MTGFIYVVGNDTQVKIGYSGKVSPNRPLDVMKGRNYRFVVALLGNRDEEGALHRRYNDLLLPLNGDRETFSYDGELREYIEWLQEQPFSAIDLSALDRMYVYPYRFPWNRLEPSLSDGAQLEFDATKRLRDTATLRERRRHQLFVQLSSESDDYTTPPCYISAARSVMNGIDLDPASNPTANVVVRANRIFTIQDDGLRHEWHGRIWLNPPYGGQQMAFVDKALAELGAGRVEQIVFCLNAHAVETQWFQRLITYPASGLCFTHHRPRFAGGATGKAPDSSTPTGGIVFVYIGPNPDGFARAFGAFGFVCRQWDQPRISQDAFKELMRQGVDWDDGGDI